MFITDCSIEYYFIIQHHEKNMLWYWLLSSIMNITNSSYISLSIDIFTSLTNSVSPIKIPTLRRAWVCHLLCLYYERNGETISLRKKLAQSSSKQWDCVIMVIVKWIIEYIEIMRTMMCVVADWKDYSRTMYHFRAFFTWNQLGVSFFYCFIVLFKQHTN